LPAEIFEKALGNSVLFGRVRPMAATKPPEADGAIATKVAHAKRAVKAKPPSAAEVSTKRVHKVISNEPPSLGSLTHQILAAMPKVKRAKLALDVLQDLTDAAERGATIDQLSEVTRHFTHSGPNSIDALRELLRQLALEWDEGELE
jgi:hypothetical protein